MRWAAQAAWAGFFATCVSTSGICAAAQDANMAGSSPAAAEPTIDGMVGKTLMAIDGSLISLTASEGGLSREIVTPNGAVQTTAFRFINDRLGTVMDPRDAGKITGVFRIGTADIEIQYGDGSSETLLANRAGGLSLETSSKAAGPYCTAWYPEGHVFTVEDRKAALAQYASRLGLADGASPAGGCGAAGTVHAADAVRTGVAVKPEAVKAGVKIASAASLGKAALPKTTAEAAADAAKTIEVRNSEVRPIDPPAAGDSQTNTKIASLELTQGTVAPGQRGASSCLSVESDGSHWGFRNHCAYTVQFAYCLRSGAALASCSDGAVAGSVAGNGFGALVADESLKETDAAHDFRWVACQGGAGEVIPHLDAVDPPSGRCVR